MPVPKTQEELIQQSQETYRKLNTLIDSYSLREQESEFSPGTMNRNIRDVLGHLHCWHVMLNDWYQVGMKGGNPVMPAKGYTWKDTQALNRKIWEDCQEIELEGIRNQLNESFLLIQEMIGKHTTEELFEKKRFHWTGSSNLATYIRVNTASHYTWAYKLIKRMKK